MATTTAINFFTTFTPIIPRKAYSTLSPQHLHISPRNARSMVITRVSADNMLGDVGARDPFPEELASNFGEKVLGPENTEHKILVPSASALLLSSLTCSTLSPDHPPMTLHEAKKLLFKVIGWRLVEDENEVHGKTVLKITCVWKLRDGSCADELVKRVNEVAEVAGHFPVLFKDGENVVKAEIWSKEIDGLSLNDFILAAKIDEVKTSDLIRRTRAWA